MNFSSSSVGQDVFIIRIGNGLSLVKGKIKSKQTSSVQFSAVNIVVDAAGQELTFGDIPSNLSIAQKGCDILALTISEACTTIKAQVNNSKKIVESIPEQETIISSGEELLEQYDSVFAEERRQAKIVSTLQKQQAETDSRLSNIEARTEEILQLLQSKKSKSLD